MSELKWAIPLGLVLGLGAVYLTKHGQQEQTRSTANPSASAFSSVMVFVRPGCPPCERTKRDLARHQHGMDVQWVDIHAQPEQKQRWRVQGTPTYVFVDGYGNEVSRHVGYLSPSHIRQWGAGQR